MSHLATWSVWRTLSTQLLLTRRLPGLMSLCRIPAEWRYFSPSWDDTESGRKKKRMLYPVSYLSVTWFYFYVLASWNTKYAHQHLLQIHYLALVFFSHAAGKKIFLLTGWSGIEDNIRKRANDFFRSLRNFKLHVHSFSLFICYWFSIVPVELSAT